LKRVPGTFSGWSLSGGVFGFLAKTPKRPPHSSRGSKNTPQNPPKRPPPFGGQKMAIFWVFWGFQGSGGVKTGFSRVFGQNPWETPKSGKNPPFLGKQAPPWAGLTPPGCRRMSTSLPPCSRHISILHFQAGLSATTFAQGIGPTLSTLWQKYPSGPARWQPWPPSSACAKAVTPGAGFLERQRLQFDMRAPLGRPSCFGNRTTVT